jgi:hypothetical protein
VWPATDTRGRYADTTISLPDLKAACRITVHSAQDVYSPVTALRACVMMACNRRAKACAVTVHTQRVSVVPPPDRRFCPNSDSTASLLGNAGSGHCTDVAAHDHTLVVDTHINFSIERTTERSSR